MAIIQIDYLENEVRAQNSKQQKGIFYNFTVFVLYIAFG